MATGVQRSIRFDLHIAIFSFTGRSTPTGDVCGHVDTYRHCVKDITSFVNHYGLSVHTSMRIYFWSTGNRDNLHVLCPSVFFWLAQSLTRRLLISKDKRMPTRPFACYCMIVRRQYVKIEVYRWDNVSVRYQMCNSTFAASNTFTDGDVARDISPDLSTGLGPHGTHAELIHHYSRKYESVN